MGQPCEPLVVDQRAVAVPFVVILIVVVADDLQSSGVAQDTGQASIEVRLVRMGMQDVDVVADDPLTQLGDDVKLLPVAVGEADRHSQFAEAFDLRRAYVLMVVCVPRQCIQVKVVALCRQVSQQMVDDRRHTAESHAVDHMRHSTLGHRQTPCGQIACSASPAPFLSSHSLRAGKPDRLAWDTASEAASLSPSFGQLASSIEPVER